MKKFVSVAMLFAVMMITAIAFAVGPAPLSTNRVPIQSIMPEPSKSVCTTIAPGAASSVTVNVRGISSMNWAAFDDAGTPVVVKRSFNANTAYMPKSSEGWLKINQNASTVKFTGYSSASSRNFCYDAD